MEINGLSPEQQTHVRRWLHALMIYVREDVARRFGSVPLDPCLAVKLKLKVHHQAEVPSHR